MKIILSNHPLPPYQPETGFFTVSKFNHFGAKLLRQAASNYFPTNQELVKRLRMGTIALSQARII
jgi:hypothetical protein